MKQLYDLLKIFELQANRKKNDNYLNFTQVHWLHEAGSSSQQTGIEASTSCGNDLATTTMDGVSVKGHVIDVESDTTQVLLGKDTLKSNTHINNWYFPKQSICKLLDNLILS